MKIFKKNVEIIKMKLILYRQNLTLKTSYQFIVKTIIKVSKEKICKISMIEIKN